MTKKLKRIIPDAMIVIQAHEQNIWESLCNTYEIALPGTILEDELFYFGKNKTALRPSFWVETKKVIRIDAEINDYDKISQKFSSNFLLSIHRGEREALAILLSDKYQDFHLSTADAAPIKALGALNLGSLGISYEDMLIGIGKNTKKSPLSSQYTKKWFQQKIAEGFRDSSMYLKGS